MKNILSGLLRRARIDSSIPPTIIQTYDGVAGQGQKWCFFSSFHPSSEITPFVLHYLGELRDCGFNIVFCTTSDVVLEDDLLALKDICHKIIHRTNLGYDFASWAACFHVLENSEECSAILLSNDSILGPLKPLSPLFATMDSAEQAFWGLNDSLERSYHIQSFFMYFKAPVLRSVVFRRFWASVSTQPSKQEVIKRYELGLTARLMQAGLQPGVLFDASETLEICRNLGPQFQYADKLDGRGINTSLLCWYELVVYRGYPFVKADVLKVNRYNSEHVDKLPGLLAQIVGTATLDALRQQLS